MQYSAKSGFQEICGKVCAVNSNEKKGSVGKKASDKGKNEKSEAWQKQKDAGSKKLYADCIGNKGKGMYQ